MDKSINCGGPEGNNTGYGGVGIMVKEDVSQNVVEIRRKKATE